MVTAGRIRGTVTSAAPAPGLVDHAGGAVGVATGLAAAAVAAAGPVLAAMAAPRLARRMDGRTPGHRGRPGRPASDGLRLLPVGVVTGVAGGAYLPWLLRGERGGARLRQGVTPRGFSASEEGEHLPGGVR